MRKRTLMVVLVSVASILSFAQQSPLHKADIDALLEKLRSSNGGERAQAFQQLKSDPAALRSARVRTGLLDLLGRENRENDLRMREAQRPGQQIPDTKDAQDNGEGEGMAEYFSDLDATVDSFADWNDPHQACILVKSGDVPASRAPAEAGLRERVAWPCLKQMSASDLMLDRANASRIIIELSARAGRALDPAIAQEAKQIVVRALHDQNESVRSETVKSLEKFGTEDMIPALRQVAESDPAVDKTSHNFWIREYAAKAIDAIRERASQR